MFTGLHRGFKAACDVLDLWRLVLTRNGCACISRSAASSGESALRGQPRVVTSSPSKVSSNRANARGVDLMAIDPIREPPTDKPAAGGPPP